MKQASEKCLKAFCLSLPGSRVRIRANAGCAATQGSTRQGTMMRVCGRAVPSPRLAIANKAQLVFRKSQLLGVGMEWPPQSLAQDGKPGPVSTPRRSLRRMAQPPINPRPSNQHPAEAR